MAKTMIKAEFVVTWLCLSSGETTEVVTTVYRAIRSNMMSNYPLYAATTSPIYIPRDASQRGAVTSQIGPPDFEADRAFLGILVPDEDLEATLERYAEQVAETQRILEEGEWAEV